MRYKIPSKNVNHVIHSDEVMVRSEESGSLRIVQHVIQSVQHGTHCEFLHQYAPARVKEIRSCGDDKKLKRMEYEGLAIVPNRTARQSYLNFRC